MATLVTAPSLLSLARVRPRHRGAIAEKKKKGSKGAGGAKKRYTRVSRMVPTTSRLAVSLVSIDGIRAHLRDDSRAGRGRRPPSPSLGVPRPPMQSASQRKRSRAASSDELSPESEGSSIENDSRRAQGSRRSARERSSVARYEPTGELGKKVSQDRLPTRFHITPMNEWEWLLRMRLCVESTGWDVQHIDENCRKVLVRALKRAVDPLTEPLRNQMKEMKRADMEERLKRRNDECAS